MASLNTATLSNNTTFSFKPIGNFTSLEGLFGEKTDVNKILSEKYDVEAVINKSVIPIELTIASNSFLILFIFFLLEFILAFSNQAIINGWITFLGCISFAGLFHVVSKIKKAVKYKKCD